MNEHPGNVAALRARAERGNAQAQYRMGVLYSDGRGVPQDEAEATALISMAAESGHPDAQCCMGVKCEHGFGVPRNFVRAVAWYCRAAEHGDTDAYYQLGMMYALGRGVPQDLVEAYMWTYQATCHAQDTRDRGRCRRGKAAVANCLTRAEMAAARKLAGVWTAALDRRSSRSASHHA